MVPSTRPSSDEMLCWASPPWAKSIRKDWVRGGAGVKFLLENYAVPTSGENNGDSPVCPRIVRPRIVPPHCPPPSRQRGSSMGQGQPSIGSHPPPPPPPPPPQSSAGLHGRNLSSPSAST